MDFSIDLYLCILKLYDYKIQALGILHNQVPYIYFSSSILSLYPKVKVSAKETAQLTSSINI